MSVKNAQDIQKPPQVLQIEAQQAQVEDTSTFDNSSRTHKEEQSTKDEQRSWKRKENKPLTGKSGKHAWQSRLSSARKKVTELEKKCQKLRLERDRSKRDKLLFARPKDNTIYDKTAKLVQKCIDDLNKARLYLEAGLPEKARRAGVPPGWLR